MISILIPARNEERTILEILQRIRQAVAGLEAEIIVVDDGSSDRTGKLAASLEGVTVMRLEPSRGKGAALKAGLEIVRGDIVIIQDADLEYDPADYAAMIAPFQDHRTQVVYGSRWLGARLGRQVGVSSFRFYWGGRFLSWLTSLLYGATMTDVATGYKLFRTPVLRGLDFQATGFEFCPEVTGRLLKQGIRILEVPISYSPRTIAEGKKIRWTDGLVAIWTLFKFRFLR